MGDGRMLFASIFFHTTLIRQSGEVSREGG